MKRISLLVLLLVAGLLVSPRPALGGSYDELLPEAVKGKPVVPSIKLRWEYDDNIYTTTDGEKATYGVSEEESWKLYVEPLAVPAGTTVRAVAVRYGWAESPEVSATVASGD